MIPQQQLELGLDRVCRIKARVPQTRHLSRAQWWFAQMRRVVDHALDWQPAPPAPPEQIWLAEPQRQHHA